MCLLWLSLAFTVQINVRIGQNTVQPRLEIGTLPVLVKRGKGLRIRLLNEVFGVCRIPAHA